MMTEARAAARAVLESDPQLSRPGHEPLREFVDLHNSRRPAVEG
jgi:hypothetical protein